MSGKATGQPDPVAEFEAAMAARDGQRARMLLEDLPPQEQAQNFARAFNMLAFGVDRDTVLSLEEMKEVNEECAQRAVAHIVDEHGGNQSCDNPRTILYDARIAGGPIHERDAPWICYRLVADQALTPKAAREMARWAWTMCEFPEANFDSYGWHFVFRMIRGDGDGPVTDIDAEDWDEMTRRERALLLPTEPVRLYRGAVTSRSAGMAWTGDRDRAEWFARRWDGLSEERGAVYTALVEPERVYARFTGRREDEYVIDTIDLAITEAADGVTYTDGAETFATRGVVTPPEAGAGT